MSDTPTRNQRAIETTGAVDEAGRLYLDEPLDGTALRAVRVLVLFDVDDEEMGEQAWLRAASRNPAFEFLNDPEEASTPPKTERPSRRNRKATGRRRAMTKGKVVLVPFPFDDLSTSKVRPRRLPDQSVRPVSPVLAFVTSRLPSEPAATDVILREEAPDFEQTGLKVSSALRLHRVVTVFTSLMKRELGALSSKRQAEVDERLRQLFDL